MQIAKAKFEKILAVLGEAVARKSTLPITLAVLLGEGTARATNLDRHISVSVPELDGAKVALPHVLLSQMVRRFPNGDLVMTPALEEGRCNLHMGSQEVAVYTAGSADEFPSWGGEALPHRVTIDGDFFIRALAEVQMSAATDDKRPVLNGVLLDLGEEATLVGTDGFRLAFMSLNRAMARLHTVPDQPPKARGRRGKDAPAAEPPSESDAAPPANHDLVIPLGTVQGLMRLWKMLDLEGNDPQKLMQSRRLAIEYSTDRIRFTIPAHWSGQAMPVTLTSRLIPGQYPKYRLLIPEAKGQGVVFQADLLAAKVKFLAPIANEATGIIRMVWGNDQLFISARGEKSGAAGADIRAATQGAGRIAFNEGLLSDYLKGRTGTVVMHYQSQAHPGLFTHEGHATEILMPMSVLWGDEPPAAAEPDKEDEPEEAPE